MSKKQVKSMALMNLTPTLFAILSSCLFLLFPNQTNAQNKLIEVDRFDEIVVSPHIEVVFREGDEASVLIEDIKVPFERLNLSIENQRLHLFLDGAKITSPNLKQQTVGSNTDTPVYDGTIVKAVVTYPRLKSTYHGLKSIDLRGEEKYVFEDLIDTNKLRLKIYGESEVYFNHVVLDELQVSMYGESTLEILNGEIEEQRFTIYGESEVNTLGIKNEETKVTIFGEAEFELYVSEKLTVTSFGEATIEYNGDAELQKRIIIGETEITRL